jgi:endonuclease-3
MPFILLDKSDAKKAITILFDKYPHSKYYLNFNTPIDLLVAAILSAQTKDEVVNSSTVNLFKKYKTAEDYASSNPSDLSKYVGKINFSGNKINNIIKACKILVEKYDGKVPRDMGSLTELPGIGRKTANTILINAYGITEGIPVDTWVIKLSKRIGLSKNDGPEDIERDLMGFVDKTYWGKIAYVFKAHGKAICQSKIPICSECVLNKLCPKNDVQKSK